MAITFVVQTDDGLAINANSYADVTYIRQYHENNGTKVTLDGENVAFIDAGYTDTEIQASAIAVTNYIDVKDEYRGNRLTDTQTTEFPRSCLFDDKGNQYVGIFEKLKRATAEYVALDLQGILRFVPTVDASGQQITMKREKVGPLEEETQYAAGGVVSFRAFPIADNILSALTESFRVRTYRV